MSNDSPSIEIAGIFHRDEDSAAVATFLQLLRHSTCLRRWLWQKFGQSEKTRDRLAQCIDGEIVPIRDGNRLLAWLADENTAYADTRTRLKERYAGRLNAPTFGGLSRREVERLVRRYQAGNTDFGAYFLLYVWRKHLAEHGRYEMRLLRANQVFLAALAGQGGGALAKQLIKAQAYFADWQGPDLLRGDYGFADWWKISVLLFMLNNPKPKYRTGEFCRDLAAQRLTVDPKDVRAFCKKHGIARDSRVGRPRKL